MTPEIRRAESGDLDAMWDIFQPLLASGDAFPFGTGFEKSTFQLHWFSNHPAYVACVGQQGGNKQQATEEQVAAGAAHGNRNASRTVGPHAQPAECAGHHIM